MRDLTIYRWVGISAAALAVVGAGLCSATLVATDEPEKTNVIVVVKEAESGQPIFNAKLTLQFRDPGDPSKLKLGKTLSFSAKTNPQGRYKFTGVIKGTIRLLVTAERRQSFGQEFELEQDDQVIEVKLRKPQPLL
jgi:hypothetical protein